MNINIILVELTILIPQVLCEKSITVTDNLRKKIALEVLKVSPVSTVVSPFALSLPLCKLASVARGHAKLELMSALGIPRESEIENCYSNIYQEYSLMRMMDLMVENVMYLNESLKVDPAFTNNSGHYGIRIDKVGFSYPKAAAKYMNRWFAQETLYRVSTLIDDEDIDNTTSIVLLSGLYYKPGWESLFDIQFTRPKQFYNMENGFSSIPMICKIDSFDYLDDVNNHVKVITIRLGTPGVSITFFLPDARTGLPDLIQKLSEDSELMKKMMGNKPSKVLRVYLPRMKIKTYVDWTGFIRLIGINDIFSVNGSGLEGMLQSNTEGHVYLSKAKQKVFMELDETGVIRRPPQSQASRTRDAQEFEAFGDNVEQLEFDHPFLFVVQLVGKGIQHQVLTGVFYGPQEE